MSHGADSTVRRSRIHQSLTTRIDVSALDF
jgi:hypothetical protein